MSKLLLLVAVSAALLLTAGLAAAHPTGPPAQTPEPTVDPNPPIDDLPIEEDPEIEAPPVEDPPPRSPRRERAPAGLCPPVEPGEHCGPGNGRRTGGGGDKVSHKGWPAITGVFFVVQAHGGKHRFKGTRLNDELLGYDGHDHLSGGKGSDVIWGGYKPVPDNPPNQRDTLLGGPGKDFIYPSHGRNVVKAGRGNDRIYAHWGRGVIDCGPGNDWLGVNKFDMHFKTRHCERVVQW
jgi:RTX calcium-binding nonapeptide repeat (4 copies)